MLSLPRSLVRLSVPFRIAALYLLLGGVWILWSDQLLSLLTRDPASLTQLQTLKGWLYVGVTSALLYFLIRRDFSALSLSRQALLESYDATLEGWARALNLRDHETQQHTQRVTDLTCRLGQAMGLSEAQLLHVRRGALLHDIGKMGIPDSILLKPGPLTDEEWDIMRRHPVYARDILLPIAYLRPALDIPYAHHEKWDGAGYPRGLAGEQIPLAARLFAVVDVWDALTSERPYRPAWSEERALEYIRAEAGRHFDPQVVAAFLKILSRI